MKRHSLMIHAVTFACAALLCTGCDKDEPVIGNGITDNGIVKMKMQPSEKIAIPWDYKHWNNIADTIVKNIVVEQPDKLVNPGWNYTFNSITGRDCTEGTATVSKNGPGAVDVQIKSSARYGVSDTVYTQRIYKYDDKTEKVYAGEFDYIVKARPADIVVNLGTKNTLCNTSEKTRFENLPVIGGILEKQGEYYECNGRYPDRSKIAEDIVKELRPMYDSLQVYFNGEEVSWVSYGFSIEVTDSKFAFNINEPGQYEFRLFDHAFGVNYTFSLKVNASKE